MRQFERAHGMWLCILKGLMRPTIGDCDSDVALDMNTSGYFISH